MTVFVAQQPRPFQDRNSGEWRLPDLSPATQYGAVHFVLSDKDQPSLTPGQALITARKALRGFNDDDYLLWAGGDPLALAICTMVAAAENMGRIRFLRWERNSRRVAPNMGAPGLYMPCEVRYA